MTTKVRRTESIWLKPNSGIGTLCHISKNLYNEANYMIRKEFLSSGKWLRYYSLYHRIKSSNNYKQLPAKTAQQTLIILDRNWCSFFRARKEYMLHPDKFMSIPKPPRYKAKSGEFVLVFTKQQIKVRKGAVFLSRKLDLKVKTRLNNVKIVEAKILPKGIGYLLEISYEREIPIKQHNHNNIIGIDMGIRNLATIVNNIGKKPIVVKGGIVKSINQFYNKRKSYIQNIYSKQGVKIGKKLIKLTVTRNKKMSDVFHKMTRMLINWCVENNIGTIVVGYNPGWKNRTRLGHKNNQNFVGIPFTKLLDQIMYKSEEESIITILQDESHTSKCSFLDNESIKHHEKYIGKRFCRGLFRSANGTVVNADVNAAYNIIRKAVPNAFADGVEGVGLHPERIPLSNGVLA